jgi:3-oxosteroid 1-dehydrogenase
VTNENERASEREVDVVVVGAGAAGCVAALRAAEGGAQVVVVEAAAQAGGTTAKSSGGYWIPNNSLMRARGLDDPRPDALRYMARMSFPELYDPQHETLGLDQRDYFAIANFYDRAGETIDWLTERGYLSTIEMVGFNGVPGDFAPYYEQPDLDRAPYGRHLGPAYDEEAVRLFADRPMRGQGGLAPAVGGQGDGHELSRQLLSAMARVGVELLLEHRVERILSDGEAVAGVVASTPNGTTALHTRQGVIFASGGFSADPELSDGLLAGPIYGTGATATCRGDFIRLTDELGVELGNVENAWWCQVPLEAALDGRVMQWLMFMPFGDSMVIVNREGKRVVNEKAVYNDRGPAHFIGGAAEAYPNRVLMMIYDDAVAQSEVDYPTRWPVPLPDGELSLRAEGIDERALVISGDTWEQLAENISKRLAGVADRTDGFTLAPGFVDHVKATVAAFNRSADAGVDEDFHRGEARIQKDMSGPARDGNDGNQTMFPLRDTGPYHCILLGAGTLETKGGPRTDANSQVLRTDGSPIPGLYGAGNCIANATAQAYWSGGATLGTAIVTGYLAGASVSRDQLTAAAAAS